MKIGRRQFNGFLTGAALVASTGGATFLLDACNATTVFQDIEAWVCPTGGGSSVLDVAVKGIISLLGPFMPPGAQVLIDAIFGAITVACNAVSEYLATTPPPVGVLTKIMTALKDVADNLQAFLSAFNVAGNPIIAVVLGLAQVIISTIASFLNRIGTAIHRKMAVKATVEFGGVTVAVVPKARTVKVFKSDWNSVCAANGQTGIELQ